jgi:hypothetical protein
VREPSLDDVLLSLTGSRPPDEGVPAGAETRQKEAVR